MNLEHKSTGRLMPMDTSGNPISISDEARYRITVEAILKRSEHKREVELRLHHILFVAAVLLGLAWLVVNNVSTSIGQ